MTRMIDNYNLQVKDYAALLHHKKVGVEKFIDNDPQKISWTVSLKTELAKFEIHEFSQNFIVSSIYRPFCKQWIYFNRRFNERVYQTPKIFPNESVSNLGICVPSIGATKDFSVIIINTLPDLNIQNGGGQCFPLYVYEQHENDGVGLFGKDTSTNYVRRDNITDAMLVEFRKVYDNNITKEDIFYYVYGILHSPEYKQRFESDLKKMLPRSNRSPPHPGPPPQGGREFYKTMTCLVPPPLVGGGQGEGSERLRREFHWRVTLRHSVKPDASWQIGT